MKIYTKTGDDGTTALIGGTRVSKADARIEAYGTIDELMAFTAYLADHRKTNKHVKYILTIVLDRLMVCAAWLASEKAENTDSLPALEPDDIVVLEKEIDVMEKHLAPLSSFILPMGHEQIDRCHIARTVCRRAERKVAILFHDTHDYTMMLKYLNRLSDYFFVLSRYIAKERRIKEILWNPKNI